MKITKKDNKIIVEIPFYSDRSNPYMEGQDVGKYPTLTGLIIKNKGDDDYDELGFAQTIDMDYKDKGDQVGDFIIKWHQSEDKFRKKCDELGLNIQEITL